MNQRTLSALIWSVADQRRKGDHCLIGGRERPYRFTSIEQLG